MVAPFTGAWIEMTFKGARELKTAVAPFTGAWIEILKKAVTNTLLLTVAPFTGAWIEI